VVPSAYSGVPPLEFTANRGQWPEDVLFRTCSGGATIWITREGVVYQFTRQVPRGDVQLPGPWQDGLAALSGAHPAAQDRRGHGPDSIEQLLVNATFAGAQAVPEAIGLGEVGHRCNYFLGNDPAQWRTDVANYSAVLIKNLYPGVSVRYFDSGDGRVAYELETASDADVERIQVTYEGAQEGALDGRGKVVVRSGWGQIIEPIDARASRTGLLSPRTLEYAMDIRRAATAHAPSQPLGSLGVGLSYSTYLGGSGPDQGLAIALGGSGNAYVTGRTGSASFPTLNPFQTYAADLDVFVTRLSGAGSSLVYSTYIGGSGYDEGWDIALDGGGNAYVTGRTASVDFPTQNPFQTNQGSDDAFVAKLSGVGNVLFYSTYLGGSGYDEACGLAVDGADNAYVAGWTGSTDFPLQNPYQANQNLYDAFVTKLSPAGNSLAYSTYIGGNSDDFGQGIAVDGNRNAYVTGWTNSSDFPTQNPYQLRQALEDVFVTKLSSAGNSLVYSTYLGGSGDEREWGGIVVDYAGNAYLTGWTESTNFPTQGPMQMNQPLTDVFVTKLSTAGNSLVYSTYLGGSDYDEGWDIALDGSRNAYVTGRTTSSDFPTQDAYQTHQGLEDAFVAVISTVGNSLIYSTYLGGADNDAGQGITLDDEGRAYAAGYASSANFPTKNPFQTHQGNSDAFVVKLGAPPVSDTLRFFAFSPVDLVVTDPMGDSIGLGFNTIGLGSTYDTTVDVNSADLSGPDGQADDRVTIPHPFAGDYQVRIIREPGAADSAKFTLAIRIDGNQQLIPDDYREATISSLGVTVPDTYGWSAATTLPGDVNADGVFTASDIIHLVNYVFKGGPPPVVPGHGDCNCDGLVTAADVIMLVNHVFKSGLPPCSQSAGP
jgi:hypothetical protein